MDFSSYSQHTLPTHRFLFFTGKGGVGKTSLACATAVALADAGRKVLLISTDPASNLDDVLGTRLSNRPTSVEGADGLDALNIDPEVAAVVYRERIIGPVRGQLPDAVLRSMEEQLSGACTVEIAAFDEFTEYLGNPIASEKYEHIVFDTAPTGHTLRLLRLPAAWATFLSENTSGVSCLGPMSGLNRQREVYERSLASLSDPEITRLILVARPDEPSLREASRASKELSDLGIRNQALILNGLFDSDPGSDPIAIELRDRQQSSIRQFADFFETLPVHSVSLRGRSLLGPLALREILSGRAESDSAPATLPELPEGLAPMDDLIDCLASANHGVVLTMGKGGVGKTTLACAIAEELARRGKSVCLTTTDPAAHVAETVTSVLPNLRVERIDPRLETERYREQVMTETDAKLDEAGRALLEEDLRSPCTEEIAVFHAFARTLENATHEIVVIDTAPTGHTLLLLDATEAYHREISRSTGNTLPDSVRQLLPRLRDPDFTRVLIVTLPEPTPVNEARALEEDLARSGIRPWAWLVNQSLAAEPPSHPTLRQRAAEEASILNEIVAKTDVPVALIPWQNTGLTPRGILGSVRPYLSNAL